MSQNRTIPPRSCAARAMRALPPTPQHVRCCRGSPTAMRYQSPSRGESDGACDGHHRRRPRAPRRPRAHAAGPGRDCPTRRHKGGGAGATPASRSALIRAGGQSPRRTVPPRPGPTGNGSDRLTPTFDGLSSPRPAPTMSVTRLHGPRTSPQPHRRLQLLRRREIRRPLAPLLAGALQLPARHGPQVHLVGPVHDAHRPSPREQPGQGRVR
jgi:hypothetical protein